MKCEICQVGESPEFERPFKFKHIGLIGNAYICDRCFNMYSTTTGPVTPYVLTGVEGYKVCS